VKKVGVKRLLFVGGAGSLEVKPGVQFVELPEFPVEYKQRTTSAAWQSNLKRGNQLKMF
jgi:putative NADH-flavin reductase